MTGSAMSTDDSLEASETFGELFVDDEARLERMQAAVRVIIAGVGEDVEREGLRDTPKVWGLPQA
jgi:GTP cyclohydrolase I